MSSDLKRLGIKNRTSDQDSSLSDVGDDDDDISSSESQKSFGPSTDIDNRQNKRSISPIEPPTANFVSKSGDDREEVPSMLFNKRIFVSS